MKVGILFGSRSDTERMKNAARCLEEFGIDYEAHILSAHRVPERLETVLAGMEERGCEVFICGAGLAAHLAGVVASKTVKPVVGVPLSAKLEGVDSLYSMVQMPKPVPVAVVGIDNAWNGAMLAVEILAVADTGLRDRLKVWRGKMKEQFIADNGEGVTL